MCNKGFGGKMRFKVFKGRLAFGAPQEFCVFGGKGNEGFRNLGKIWDKTTKEFVMVPTLWQLMNISATVLNIAKVN